MRADRMTLPLYVPAAGPVSGLLRRVGRPLALVLLAALYGIAVAYLPPQLIVLPMIPIVVMLLLVLWMLPDQATFPKATLGAAFTWFIVLYYVWPAYIAIALPGLPWFSAGRIALLVLMVVALYSVAISRTLRQQMFTVARASRVVGVLFAVTLVAQTLPLLWSSTPFGTLSKFVNYQMYWTAVLLIGCYLFTAPGRVLAFAKLIVGLAIGLAAFGIVEHFQQRLPWDGNIPSFLRVDEKLLSTVLSAQGRDILGGYRVHSIFTVSLIFAEFLAMAIPFLLYLFEHARSGAVRALLAAGWVTIAVCILYTDARLGRIGFILTNGGYALMWALRLRRRRPGFLSTAVMLAFPVAAAAGIGVIFASHRLHAMVFGSEAYASSNDARGAQWAMGLPKILHNPLGYGAGSAGYVLGFTSQAGQLTIDSQFLKTTLEFGVVGALATYLMLLAAGWIGIGLGLRRDDGEYGLAGAAGLMLVTDVVIKAVLAEDYNNSLSYLGVAMILALLVRARGDALQGPAR